LLSRISYASFLLWDPRPVDADGRRLRDFVRVDLKQDRVISYGGERASELVARRMQENLGRDSPIRRFLNEAVLVPAPRSAPLVRGAVWPAARIAEAMIARGFGHTVVRLLERIAAVTTSHTVVGRERPWPDTHRNSLAVERELPVDFAGRLIVVDDVLTRGSTLLGCAQALKAAYPDAEVGGFAAFRTLKEGHAMPPDPKVPAVGEIWQDGPMHREP